MTSLSPSLSDLSLTDRTQAFWDATGQLWASGALHGKYAGVFVSTAGHGGGQESTVLASLSTLAHHGVIFVPFGYAKAFGQLTNLDEVHGGEFLSPLNPIRKTRC